MAAEEGEEEEEGLRPGWRGAFLAPPDEPLEPEALLKWVGKMSDGFLEELEQVRISAAPSTSTGPGPQRRADVC